MNFWWRGMEHPEDPSVRSARRVYGISVASELSGIDPQALRLAEVAAAELGAGFASNSRR
jgi:hypothetical protein